MTEILSKSQFEDWVYKETKATVQSGPFKGMKLMRQQSWVSGALSPLLLGCYEAELHEVIKEEIARLAVMDSPKIVNVGCSEGYYAVGMALRVPHAQVWVIEPDEKGLALAHDTATLNGVKLISGEYLPQVFAKPDLVIMDCEGAEVQYLDPLKFPDLKQAHIIVELHQTKEQDTAKILTDRWEGTHEMVWYCETSRNPNVFGFLRPQSSLVRWFAVNENRPCLMAWFVMRPK